jgi:terminase, large subunit
VSAGLASVDAVIRSAMRAWKPPPRLSLSEWADRYFYLSVESSAESGRWRTLPYQRAIMDAFTDPRVERVSVRKSARIGWTKIINALVGYSIHQAPCPLLVVQPTVDDAKGYSKEEIAPMLRDCEVLATIVFEEAEEVGPRESGNTILHKKFPGGVLSLVGANSGTGFRRVSRKIVLFDEVDGYPPSAGSDGDQIELGIKRTSYYWDRKIGAGSTPLIAGASRIERLYEQGDKQRYFVPCPHCGHMAPLVFSAEHGGAGHTMSWPEGQPEEAFFACEKSGCVIEYRHKREMVERGEWRATKPHTAKQVARGKLHASFHVWAAYSSSPNTEWGQIAAEFLTAKANPETLKTFVNTVLGETWKEKGEVPDWEKLYARRETYKVGTVPEGVKFLTCGVDVQKNPAGWFYEVVGWAANKESWSIDAGFISGDTANDAEWARIDDLLGRTYPTASGVDLAILCLAVDSGDNTNTVYTWARRYPMRRVIAVKGVEKARAIIDACSPVDVKVSGKRLSRGYSVWPVGHAIVKSELYGWLRLKRPAEGEPFPAGWCHFPEYGEKYFQMLTAEHLVAHADNRGFTRYVWELMTGRENHYLDCRVYARAAAARLGLDRMQTSKSAPARTPARRPESVQAPVMSAAPPPTQPTRPRGQGGFLSRPGRGGKGWLK